VAAWMVVRMSALAEVAPTASKVAARNKDALYLGDFIIGVFYVFVTFAAYDRKNYFCG